MRREKVERKGKNETRKRQSARRLDCRRKEGNELEKEERVIGKK
jgi:hypothetical protein